MSEDFIYKQASINVHIKLQIIPLDSENGCFKSEFNLLVTQSSITIDSKQGLRVNIHS